MSQASFAVSTVSPLSGINEVLQTNAAIKALVTLQSGTAAPTSFSTVSGSTALLEGEFWLDTSVTPHVVRFYNGASFQLTFVNNPAPDAAFLNAVYGVF